MMKVQKEKKTDKKRSVLKIFICLLILCVAGFAVLGGMNVYVTNITGNDVYSIDGFKEKVSSSSDHYETVIVLGCAVWDGVASPMLADRLRTAAMVYKTGCADYILVSGDSYDVSKYDETGCMKEFLIGEGIPSDKIVCDGLGLSTYESMLRAHTEYNIKSAVVVTTGFHVARSVYDCRAFGIECVGVEAINSGYVIKKYNYVREFIARGKDILYSAVKPGY